MKLTYEELDVEVKSVLCMSNNFNEIKIKHDKSLLCGSSSFNFALRSWNKRIFTIHGEQYEPGDKIKVFWNVELNTFITSEHKDYLDEKEI